MGAKPRVLPRSGMTSIVLGQGIEKDHVRGVDHVHSWPDLVDDRHGFPAPKFRYVMIAGRMIY